jgi:hypothetical protein
MATINKNAIEKTKQVLIDNGIDEDEVETVLQAIGYTLLNKELFPTSEEKEYTVCLSVNARFDITVKAKCAKDAFKQAQQYELDINDFRLMDSVDTVPVHCYTSDGLIEYYKL